MIRFKSLVIVLIVCNSLNGQGIPMIDQIKAHSDGIALWWIGHNSWVIKSGELVICTDLFIDNSQRIAPAPVTAEELAEVLDISFITHSHGDHFNRQNSITLLEKSSCIFVLPESCLEAAAKMKIPEERILVAKPREQFEIKGITVYPTRAIHGNANYAINYNANLQDVGYLFTINGKTLYQIGDSYLLEDQLFLKKVNVLFFSPTEHNTYIEPSVILINALDPDYILPQHHSTVTVTESNRFWAKGYPDEVKIRLSRELQSRYHILKPGDKFLIR